MEEFNYKLKNISATLMIELATHHITMQKVLLSVILLKADISNTKASINCTNELPIQNTMSNRKDILLVIDYP